MALPCIHKQITKAQMASFGFGLDAQEIAGEANELVDEKQGNSSKEANLHSMCGFEEQLDPILKRPMLVLQNSMRCREVVEDLLNGAKRDIVAAATKGEHLAGLKRIGEALHTVQDRAFHNFEPWPYRGLADSLANDPNYMICHALRDLGMVSKLDVAGVARGRFDVQLSFRLGGPVFLSTRFFNNPAQMDRLPAPMGRDAMANDSFQGAGGMLSITFGAAPGSVKVQPHPEDASRVQVGESPLATIALAGPASRARAEDSTKQFLEDVQREILRAPDAGLKAWNGLRLYSDKR